MAGPFWSKHSRKDLRLTRMVTVVKVLNLVIYVNSRSNVMMPRLETFGVGAVWAVGGIL